VKLASRNIYPARDSRMRVSKMTRHEPYGGFSGRLTPVGTPVSRLRDIRRAVFVVFGVILCVTGLFFIFF
jgi:hypothetical protein